MWCSFTLVIIPPFLFGYSSILRIVVEVVTIPSPPSLHGVLCTGDIPTGHAVLASTTVLGLCSPGFRDFSCHYASVSSSVSTSPTPPRPSRQLPGVSSLPLRIAIRAPPTMLALAFHEIFALCCRIDIPLAYRAPVLDINEFPRPSRPFSLYFIAVHRDGGDCVSLFGIITFGHSLTRHVCCTNRSEYVAIRYGCKVWYGVLCKAMCGDPFWPLFFTLRDGADWVNEGKNMFGQSCSF